MSDDKKIYFPPAPTFGPHLDSPPSSKDPSSTMDLDRAFKRWFDDGYAKAQGDLDAVYAERDKCVALIARMAQALGCNVGLGEHPSSDESWMDEWKTIVFVDLPTGQVSFHVHDSERAWFDGLPKYTQPWDGHTTTEKYQRVLAARWGEADAKAV